MRAAVVIVALFAGHAHADSFYVFAGATYIEPNIDGHNLRIEATGLAKLAAPTGPIEGDISASPLTAPTAIIGYTLPHRLAIETIVGLPMTVKLTASGDLATKSIAPTVFGFLPTGIPPLGTDVAEVSALAPMVTLVYRIADLGPVTPFVGAGASVMFVTEAKLTNPVLSAPNLDFPTMVGGIVQGGLEAHLYHQWYARLDAKYLVFSDSTVTIDHVSVHTTNPLLMNLDVGTAKMDISTSPLIVLAGVGATF